MTSILADFGGFISSTFGLISWTVVCVVAGTLFGAPMWDWIKSKLPWNK
jgi:hypothetical protein